MSLPMDVIPDRLLPMLELNPEERQHLEHLNAVVRRACVRPTKQNLHHLATLVEGLPEGEMPGEAEVKRLTTPAKPVSQVQAEREARRARAERRRVAKAVEEDAAREREHEENEDHGDQEGGDVEGHDEGTEGEGHDED